MKTVLGDDEYVELEYRLRLVPSDRIGSVSLSVSVGNSQWANEHGTQNLCDQLASRRRFAQNQLNLWRINDRKLKGIDSERCFINTIVFVSVVDSSQNKSQGPMQGRGTGV